MFEIIAQNLVLLIIFVVASITILVLASNVAVNKLMGLAGYFRLSTTFMGVTVVSIATSIPEIAAHYTASFGILSGALDYEVSSAVVLGANIGSDVVQQTLIMAIVVLMAGGLRFKRYFLWKSMIPMIATTMTTSSRLKALLLSRLALIVSPGCYSRTAPLQVWLPSIKPSFQRCGLSSCAAMSTPGPNGLDTLRYPEAAASVQTRPGCGRSVR